MFSLGVSILYIANAGKIAEVNPSDRVQIDQAIVWATQDGGGFQLLRDVLQFDPANRFSAQQFLLKLLPGDREALNLPALDSQTPHGSDTKQAAWQGSSNMSF